jgi:hypothetical protein
MRDDREMIARFVVSIGDDFSLDFFSRFFSEHLSGF